MARFYGKVGFVKTIETEPDVYKVQTIEYDYIGDVLQNSRQWQTSEHLNDNLEIRNRISILANDFALENLYAIGYVEWMGSLWKVTNAELNYPRIILTLGGVYNG